MKDTKIFIDDSEIDKYEKRYAEKESEFKDKEEFSKYLEKELEEAEKKVDKILKNKN